MKLSVYFKIVVWEFVLLTLVSTGLCYVILQAFYAGDIFAASPVPALICIVFNVLLFAAASSKRRLLPFGIVIGIACLVALIASAAASSVSLASDKPGNYLIPALVFVLVNLAGFFLSRRRTEAVVLLIGSIFACSWIQFYYSANMVVWSVVVLFSALALVVYKNYQQSARTVSSAKNVSFGLGAGVAALSVAVAIGIGALVWIAVIAPLNPATVKLELITEVRAYETLQVQGTNKEYQVPNTDLTSSKLTTQSRTVDDLQEGDNGMPQPARTKTGAAKSKKTEGTFLGIDVDSIREQFDFKSNPTGAARHLILLVFLPLLIIVGYFVGRRMWRKRRLNKFKQLPPPEQAAAIFTFLMNRLARIGFALPVGMTLSEFCIHNENSLQNYEELAGASFTAMAGVYVSSAYGKSEPTDEGLATLESFYLAFWKFARKRLGNFKYFFKAFRL